jgi:4'-phosphopantetheinyl transferase
VIDDGEAHVWTAEPERLASPASTAACLEVLSPDERALHDRLRFERDRLAYRVAHAMLRHAIAGHIPGGPSGIPFTRGPGGRPELATPAGRPPLRFSLAHTTGHVACVLTRSADCGVDIEDIARHGAVPLHEELADVFAPAERSALDALTPAQRLEGFFAIWTLKESVLKACGLGIVVPLEALAFTLDTPQGDVVDVGAALPEASGPWLLRRWRASERHRAALAVRCREPERFRVVHRTWEPRGPGSVPG